MTAISIILGAAVTVSMLAFCAIGVYVCALWAKDEIGHIGHHTSGF